MEGPGAPRKFTDEQKAKIVNAAVTHFYTDTEISRILGIKSRAQVRKIIGPYLTPEVIKARKERLSELVRGMPSADKLGVTLDQIKAYPNYKNPEKYFRPVSIIPLPRPTGLVKNPYTVQ